MWAIETELRSGASVNVFNLTLLPDRLSLSLLAVKSKLSMFSAMITYYSHYKNYYLIVPYFIPYRPPLTPPVSNPVGGGVKLDPGATGAAGVPPGGPAIPPATADTAFRAPLQYPILKEQKYLLEQVGLGVRPYLVYTR